MSYKMKRLEAERYLVWDLLRETDPYYLNHHLFDVNMSKVEADRITRRAQGRPVPTYIAYTLQAYAKKLSLFPELNSYLRLWPTTKLAVYDGVDIALTIERTWNQRKIILLSLLKNAQSSSLDEICEFLRIRRDSPLETLDEFARFQKLLRIPAFCRWRLFQIFVKPFPQLLRNMVGTTAFTCIGRFGTTANTPLSPRSCTLSVGHVEVRPRVENSEVKPALSVWLTLTYDHRVADGAQVARMGNSIRDYLEQFSE